jgi:hypothetical protein
MNLTVLTVEDIAIAVFLCRFIGASLLPVEKSMTGLKRVAGTIMISDGLYMVTRS